MDFCGCVATSQAFDEDRMTGVTRRSNFMQTCGFIWVGPPFWIGWMQLKDDDSHPGISSQPFIKDEMPNPIATPNFAYLYTCSSIENVLLDFFLVDQTV